MTKTYSQIIKITILLGFMMSFLISCDDVDNVFKERETTYGDETLGIPLKKILLEEYTGHECGNCPRGAEIAHGLKETYGDHLIVVAIHAGSFAEVSEDYPEDFQTETGNKLDASYKVSEKGLPAGLINRTPYDGSEVLGKELWLAAFEKQLAESPVIDIKMTNKYNPETRKVTIDLANTFISGLSQDLNITLWLTEDSIIAPQKDYEKGDAGNHRIIKDYAHRHMLRETITQGLWGEKLASNVKANDVINKKFTFEIGKDYNAEHCEIIAFISDAKTNYIIQAESEPVIQEEN